MELIDRRLLDDDPHEGPLSEDEKRTRMVDLVNDAKIQAEQARSGLGPGADLSWHELREFYEGPGQNWDVVAPGLPSHLQDDWSVTNHVKTSCRSFAAMIVGALPVWYVVEVSDGETDEAADHTTAYLRSWAQIADLRSEETVAVINALQVGRGVLHPYWDKQRKDVVVRSVRPENIYPDPTATRLEDCAFVAIRHLYGIELALRLWPDLDLDKADSTHGEEDDFEVVQELKSSQCIIVWEVYYDFGENLMIYTGEQTLFDKPSPVPESKFVPHRYPLVFYDFESREKSFWPVGLVQELMGPQTRINLGNTRVGIWHRFFVAPVWTTESQQAKDNFDMTPGAMNYVEPESNTQPHYAPAIPSDVFVALGGAKGDLESIAGTVEVTQGLRPTGVNTGIALQVLHQAAQQRMTAPAAAWTVAKAHLGQRVLELMQKHYNDDRNLAIVNSGQAEIVPLSADDLSTPTPTGSFVDVDDEVTGQTETVPEMKPEPRKYFVITQPGGEIPMSPAARAEVAVQLAQIPVGDTLIDQEAVLDAMQFPNRDAILERRGAIVQAQAEGEQQAMAAQQQQAQSATAMQQMQNIGARLQELLPPEMFDLMQGILAGTVTDQQLIDEFMQGVQELGPEVASLVQQYLALSQMLSQAQSQPQMQ